MAYKLLVLDIDDTLLTDEHVISPKTKEALVKAQENGTKVVLASGRPTFGMWPLAEELELEKYGSFILSFNGGIITNCATKEVIYQNTLLPEMAHKLYDLSVRENVGIITYDDNKIISQKSNKYADLEAEMTGMEMVIVSDFKASVTENVAKCLMLAEPEHLEKVEAKLQKELQGEMSVMRSKPFFLELTQKNVNKGESLRVLLKTLNIEISEMIACGDGNNDLEMIKVAGLGVAMGNANDGVKAAADYVTKSNNEDGIAHVIEKFILNAEQPKEAVTQ